MFAVNPGILAAGVSTSSPGQQLFTTSGTFVVPAGVTSICVVAIGRGSTYSEDENYIYGGGGGSLGYLNALPVTPGEVLTVIVSEASYGIVSLLQAGVPVCQAQNAVFGSRTPGNTATPNGYRGGAGGYGDFGQPMLGSGGGAGGYTSSGGIGTYRSPPRGGGGSSPLGGSVGGLAGASASPSGENYGGGAAYGGSTAGLGCVRIIWGEGRAFPNTNTGDV